MWGFAFLGLSSRAVCVEPNHFSALKGAVAILEVITGRTVHSIPVGESVQRIAFSASERRSVILLACGIENKIMMTSVSGRT